MTTFLDSKFVKMWSINEEIIFCGWFIIYEISMLNMVYKPCKKLCLVNLYIFVQKTI